MHVVVRLKYSDIAINDDESRLKQRSECGMAFSTIASTLGASDGLERPVSR